MRPSIAAVALAALAIPAPCAPPDDCTLTVLPNGVRVIVRALPSARVAAIDVWVRAGSASEQPAEAGAAHFVEHVIFKGTPTRAPGEIDTAIEDLGSLLNAGTTRDAAHFYATVAPEHLAPALAVVADAVRNAVLPNRDIERERSVILAEIARRRANPTVTALDAIYAAMFPSDPYGAPITGTSDAIERVSADAVHAFHTRLYRPDAATVVIVGAVRADEAGALASRLFGDWAKPPAAATVLPTAPESAARSAVKPAVGGRAVLAAGVRFPADIASAAAAAVAMNLLGDGSRGRVAHSLAGKIAIADSSVEAAILARAGVATAILACAPDAIDQLRAAWTRETQALAAKAPDENEVMGVRRLLRGRLLYESETCEGQARLLGNYDVTAGDYRKAAEFAAAVEAVKPADVQEFVRRRLTPEATSVLVFGGRAQEPPR